MSIFVDSPQLVRVVKLYLTKSFGNLTPKIERDFVFFLDSGGKTIMEYDIDVRELWVSWSKFWDKLEYIFPVDYNNLISIVADWVEDHYGLDIRMVYHTVTI